MTSHIPSLPDGKEDVIHLLGKVGLTMNEARLLAVFFRGGKPTSQDLEKATDLRQPDVSTGINGLAQWNWVGISSPVTVPQGVHHTYFILTKPVDRILDEIRENCSVECNQQKIMLGQLRKKIAR